MARPRNIAANDNYPPANHINNKILTQQELLAMQLTPAQEVIFDVLLHAWMVLDRSIPDIVAYRMAKSVDYKTTSHEVHGYPSQLDYNKLCSIGETMIDNYAIKTRDSNHGF